MDGQIWPTRDYTTNKYMIYIVKQYIDSSTVNILTHFICICYG